MQVLWIPDRAWNDNNARLKPCATDFGMNPNENGDSPTATNFSRNVVYHLKERIY